MKKLSVLFFAMLTFMVVSAHADTQHYCYLSSGDGLVVGTSYTEELPIIPNGECFESWNDLHKTLLDLWANQPELGPDGTDSLCLSDGASPSISWVAKDYKLHSSLNCYDVSDVNDLEVAADQIEDAYATNDMQLMFFGTTYYVRIANNYAYVGQGSVKDANKSGIYYRGLNFSDLWKSEIETVNNLSVVTFESDIDLKGYVTEEDGTKKCVENFEPLGFQGEIFGDDYTIRNFCFIGDGAVSFFSSIPSVLRNIKFDSAYVVSNDDYAAVVAIDDRLTRTVNNIQVSNSYVSGVEKAAGVFATLSNNIKTLESVVVTNTDVIASRLGEDVLAYAGGIVGVGYAPVKDAKVENSRIRGDYAGGVYGSWERDNQTSAKPSAKNDSILDSRIEGVFVGGFAGKMELVDELSYIALDRDTIYGIDFQNERNTNYSLAAGGLAGNMTNVGTLRNISISNAVVEHKVDNNPGLSSGVNFQVAYGGLAGTAVSVKVVDGVTVASTSVKGCLYMGGFFGLTVNGDDSLKVLESKFEGSIGIVDNAPSQSGASYGGLIGLTRSGTAYLSQNSVISDFAYNGEGFAFGGLVGKSVTANLIVKSNVVKGDVSVVNASATDEIFVGGLVGQVYEAATFKILGNAHLGDISVSTTNGNVGYLVGDLSTKAEEGEYPVVKILSNYHYGEDEIAKGVGHYDGYDWESEMSSDYIWANVRNAFGSLQAKTLQFTPSELHFHTNQIVAEGGYANAIISSDDMKSDALAAIFNVALTEDAVKWTRTDDVNDGLPSFETNENKACWPVSFVVIYKECLDNDNSPCENGEDEAWAAAQAKYPGARIISFVETHHKRGVMGFTNSKQKLPDEFIAEINEIAVDSSKIWLSGNSGIPESMAFDRSYQYDLGYSSSYTVSYQVCKNGVCSDVDEGGYYFFLSDPVKSIKNDSTSLYQLIPTLVYNGYMDACDLLTIKFYDASGDEVTPQKWNSKTLAYETVEVAYLLDENRPTFYELLQKAVPYVSGFSRVEIQYDASSSRWPEYDTLLVKNFSTSKLNVKLNGYQETSALIETHETSKDDAIFFAPSVNLGFDDEETFASNEFDVYFHIRRISDFENDDFIADTLSCVYQDFSTATTPASYSNILAEITSSNENRDVYWRLTGLSVSTKASGEYVYPELLLENFKIAIKRAQVLLGEESIAYDLQIVRSNPKAYYFDYSVDFSVDYEYYFSKDFSLSQPVLVGAALPAFTKSSETSMYDFEGWTEVTPTVGQGSNDKLKIASSDFILDNLDTDGESVDSPIEPVWDNGANTSTSTAFVCITESADGECATLPLTGSLMQTVDIGSANGDTTFKYDMNGRKKRFAFVGDDAVYEFNVEIEPYIGYRMNSVTFDNSKFRTSYLNYAGKDDPNIVWGYDASTQKLTINPRVMSDSANRLIVDIDTIDYVVYFTLDESEDVYLGNSMTSTLVRNINTFKQDEVHVYKRGSSGYAPSRWDLESAIQNPDMHKVGVDGAPDTVWLVADDGRVGEFYIYVFAVDDDVAELSLPCSQDELEYYVNQNAYMAPEEYHGTLVLKQTYKDDILDLSFSHESELIPGRGEYILGLLVPNSDDTLSMVVGVNPDVGYEMHVKQFSRNALDSKNPLREVPNVPKVEWGYNSETDSLKINSKYMRDITSAFFVSYTLTPYKLSFDLSPFEDNQNLFVSNRPDNVNNVMVVDWERDAFHMGENLPVVLSVHEDSYSGELRSCLVKWKQADVENDYRDIFLNENFAAVFGHDSVNTKAMVLDTTNYLCDSVGVQKLTLHTNGHGTLKMVQLIPHVNVNPNGSNDTTYTYVTHDFTVDPNTGDSILYVPRTWTNFMPNGYGVKLMAVTVPSENYVLDEISFDCDYDGYPGHFAGPDSMLLDITHDFILRANFNLKYDPQLVFDVNTDANVFFGNTWASKGKFLEGDDFPMQVYRSDACLLGWSTTKGATTKFYSSMDGTFVDEYFTLLSYGAASDTLYAVWDEYCSVANVVVKPANANTGEFTLTQMIDGLPYNTLIAPEGTSIPLVQGGVPFKISFVPNPGYSFAAGANISSEGANGLANLKNGDEFVVSEASTLDADVEPVSFTLSFGVNAGNAKVFFGDDWQKSTAFSLDGASLRLPTNVYRTDARLAGWALSKQPASNEIYTDFNADLVQKLDASAAVTDLYAIWTSADVDTCVLKLADASVGELTVSQTLADTSVTYDVPALGLVVPAVVGGMHFDVSFSAADGYIFGRDSEILVNDGSATNTITNNESVNVASDLTFTPATTGAPYRFVYNVNAGGSNVFFGASWSNHGEFALGDDSLGLPTELYRTDARLTGWSLNKKPTGNGDVFDSFGTGLVGRLGGQAVDTLFAVWTSDDFIQTYMVNFANSDIGKLVLAQDLPDTLVTFDVPAEGLEVPVVRGGIKFKARYSLNSGYTVVEDSLYVIDSDGRLDSTLDNGNLNVTRNVTLAVPLAPEGIRFTFDVNTELKNVFYGDDWYDEYEYELSNNGFGQSLPAWVYSTEYCVAGWSLVKTGKRSDMYTNFSQDLVTAVKDRGEVDEQGRYKLYAVWTEAANCVNYNRVTLVTHNGSVELVERKSEPQKLVVHPFSRDNAMILPNVTDGNRFSVRSYPDSSFVLDSVGVSRRDGLGDQEIYMEGAPLSYSLELAVITAYFSKSNRTPISIVDSEFKQTGNAVEVAFKLSDFEVTRGAKVSITLMDAMGVVVSSAQMDSVASGLDTAWNKFPINPGKYSLNVRVFDAKDTADIDTSFNVVAEIAAVVKDGWQMLSLATLDKSALVWDDDPRFYWWDESSVSGEFWQYQQLTQRDEIVNDRGYWYSTLEGRPLPLRSNIDDDGADVVWNLDSVSSGWNLVANPHGWSLDLYGDNPSAKGVNGEDAEITFLKFNTENNSYEPTETLAPYEAVWVQVKSSTQWKVPAKPMFGKTLAKRNLAKAVDSKNWAIQLKLSDANGNADTWNVLGAGSKPAKAEEPPESMGEHVNLSIVDGKKPLAKSVKASADELEWTVELSATGSRMGYLSVVGAQALRDLGLKVFVTVDGETTEMLDGDQLKVPLAKKAKTATVRVAPNAKVVVSKQLEGLRAIHSGSALQVRFEAGEALSGSKTRVDLMDMKGHVVSSYSGMVTSGTNLVTLNAPKGGLYMLRVRAGGEQSAARVMVR